MGRNTNGSLITVFLTGVHAELNGERPDALQQQKQRRAARVLLAVNYARPRPPPTPPPPSRDHRRPAPDPPAMFPLTAPHGRGKPVRPSLG